MIKRKMAVDACMLRFNGKQGRPGVRDCGKLASHALNKMGHKATVITASKHKSWASAISYLKDNGFNDLFGLMDATELPRIAPACALPGDIIAMPTDEEGFGCTLTVYLGNGFILAFNSLGVAEPTKVVGALAAWRL